MFQATKRPAERVQPERAAKSRKLNDKRTKLVDLNFDCLIRIFKFLSPTELASVYEYSEQFLAAAQYVLRTKFSNVSPIVTNDPNFDETGKSRMVKLIKAFGCVLGSLKINYSHSSRRYDWMIEKAIMRYCRTTVKSISFDGAANDIMPKISEPFNAVERVYFTKCELGHLVMNLSKWFPNANYLSLCGTPRRAKSHIFKYPHPNLRELLVCDTRMNNSDLICFLKANPQLETLTFACDAVIEEGNWYSYYDGIKLTEDLITTLKTELQHLKYLNIFIPNGMEWRYDGWTEQIYFEHFDTLIISNASDTNIWENFPITVGSVNNLALNGNLLNCAMFIEQNRNIKSLAIDGAIEKLEQIIRTIDVIAELPNLEYLQLRNDREMTRHIMGLLQRCEKLKVLVFFYSVAERDPRCHPHHKPHFYVIGDSRWHVEGYAHTAKRYNRTLVYRRCLPMVEPK